MLLAGSLMRRHVYTQKRTTAWTLGLDQRSPLFACDKREGEVANAAPELANHPRSRDVAHRDRASLIAAAIHAQAIGLMPKIGRPKLGPDPRHELKTCHPLSHPCTSEQSGSRSSKLMPTATALVMLALIQADLSRDRQHVANKTMASHAHARQGGDATTWRLAISSARKI